LFFLCLESHSTTADSNSQSSGVIKLASIKAIIESGRHCLLDITPNAVDHLNYAQYFPICIYLKTESRSHAKELRQKYAKNLKAKSCKRLYENAMKLQTYYSHLFTATVQLDSSSWFKKLKEAIDQQQTQPLWISEELDQIITNGSNNNVTINNSNNNYELQNHQLQQRQQQQQAQHYQKRQNQLLIASSTQPNCIINEQPLASSINDGNFSCVDAGHYYKINSTSTLNNNIKESTTNNGNNNNNNNNFSFNLFDDNFEFPIYTSANPISLSTYSLYDEHNNYRSSFAASDSDICGTVNGNQSASINYSKNMALANQIDVNQIYSTNFHNSASRVHNMQNLIDSQQIYVAGAVPVIATHDSNLTQQQQFQCQSTLLNKVHSDPELLTNADERTTINGNNSSTFAYDGYNYANKVPNCYQTTRINDSTNLIENVNVK
jgi:hypothetical protein